MDGDLAPLVRLAELAREYDAMLMVDEAHATGVFGATGRGLVEHFAADCPDLHEHVHIRVGTLSKALGTGGGFVVGRQSLDRLAGESCADVRLFNGTTGGDQRGRESRRSTLCSRSRSVARNYWQTAAKLRARLGEQGWNTGQSESQIIPLIVGDPEQTMRFAERLREGGFFVPGIRPPSVPRGRIAAAAEPLLPPHAGNDRCATRTNWDSKCEAWSAGRSDWTAAR